MILEHQLISYSTLIGVNRRLFENSLTTEIELPFTFQVKVRVGPMEYFELII